MLGTYDLINTVWNVVKEIEWEIGKTNRPNAHLWKFSPKFLRLQDYIQHHQVGETCLNAACRPQNQTGKNSKLILCKKQIKTVKFLGIALRTTKSG